MPPKAPKLEPDALIRKRCTSISSSVYNTAATTTNIATSSEIFHQACKQENIIRQRRKKIIYLATLIFRPAIRKLQHCIAQKMKTDEIKFSTFFLFLRLFWQANIMNAFKIWGGRARFFSDWTEWIIIACPTVTPARYSWFSIPTRRKAFGYRC